MTKKKITGFIMLGIFVSILIGDAILLAVDMPTFSRWMTDAAQSWPFGVAAGTGFAWGVLTGHWAVPMFAKKKE